MRFGIGDLPVKIVLVDCREQFVQHFTAFFFEFIYQAATTCHQDEIGSLLKLRAGGVRFDQTDQVLFAHRSRDG